MDYWNEHVYYLSTLFFRLLCCWYLYVDIFFTGELCIENVVGNREKNLFFWILAYSLKRSKGSSHLRRSISQPLDLDKAYDTPLSTLRKCRSPTNTPKRRQRRPSAGNILNEDNTTSEDEIGMSDSEDFRTDLKRSLEEVCSPWLFGMLMNAWDNLHF